MRNRQAIRSPNCLPVNEPSFHNWLCESRMKIGEQHRRGFDTVVTLVAWDNLEGTEQPNLQSTTKVLDRSGESNGGGGHALEVG
uniref:Uncharacterized protein n=1 Tax=Oryza meridionalis TaxID=40149 RepID=A0A0E0EB63_9ORYZ